MLSDLLADLIPELTALADRLDEGLREMDTAPYTDNQFRVAIIGSNDLRAAIGKLDSLRARLDAQKPEASE